MSDDGQHNTIICVASGPCYLPEEVLKIMEYSPGSEHAILLQQNTLPVMTLHWSGYKATFIASSEINAALTRTEERRCDLDGPEGLRKVRLSTPSIQLLHLQS